MATQFDNLKDLQPSEWLEQRFRLSRRDSSVADPLMLIAAAAFVVYFCLPIV